jgi:hypothetical protein
MIDQQVEVRDAFVIPTIEDMLRILQEAEKLKVTDDGTKLSIPSISNNFTLATQAKLIKSGSKLTVTQKDSVTSLLMQYGQKYFVN